MDISIGHVRDRNAAMTSFFALSFGALLFVWSLISGHPRTAWSMLCIFWIIAGLCIGRYLCAEYLSEGDDLIVDVCKCAPPKSLPPDSVKRRLAFTEHWVCMQALSLTSPTRLGQVLAPSCACHCLKRPDPDVLLLQRCPRLLTGLLLTRSTWHRMM